MPWRPFNLSLRDRFIPSYNQLTEIAYKWIDFVFRHRYKGLLYESNLFSTSLHGTRKDTREHVLMCKFTYYK